MSKPPFQITSKILNLSSSISKEIGKIEASSITTPEPKLRKQNRIKTIQATLAIEGNTLTLDQMTAVLEGKKVLGSKQEVLEVQNAIKLYDSLSAFSLYSTKDFLKAHRVLMKGLVTSAGSFRNKNVGVLKGSKVSHVAPKPNMVPKLINNLLSWAKSEKELSSLIKSCIVHYEIEFIHPFEDGNGRMGRFWQTVILSKGEQVFNYLPMESLIKDSQKKYYKVLEACDKAGDCTQFIEFMLEIILESLENFSSDFKGLVLDDKKRLLQAKEHFGKRDFSRKSYMLYFKNISSATASRDLKTGVEQGLLKKLGEGNQTRYRFK